MTSLYDLWITSRDLVDEPDNATIAAYMLGKDPELCHAWHDARLLADLTAWVGVRERAANVLQRERKSPFVEAVEDAEDGDITRLTIFATQAPFTIEGTRKREGELTGPDQRAIAGEYQGQARYASLQASIRAALAKKQRGKRVDEVFTEEQYRAFFDDTEA